MNTPAVKIDLENLDHAELIALKNKVDAAIASVDARKRQEALAAAEKAVSEFGFSLKDLTNPTSAKKAKRQLAEPKYAHPENSQLTWAGKGRRPSWFVTCIESGMKPEELAIQASFR